MFYKTFLLCAVFATVCSTVSASPAQSPRSSHRRTLADAARDYPALRPLQHGNDKFRREMEKSNPDLLWGQKDAQHPEILYIGCGDSRVSEGLIFSPLPGTIFTERNVANQYLHEDIGTVAALGFGVRFLKVGHVIVMGHYGCGGVKAATHPGPANPDRVEKTLNTWIDPIRSLYHNSTRPEVVTLRKYREAHPDAEGPKFEDPGFRALVEENVENTVSNIARDSIMTDHWNEFLEEQKNGYKPAAGSTPLKPVFVHGFVYDISTGKIYDMDVSQGPPGYKGDYSKCKRNLLDSLRRGDADPSKVEGC